MGFSKSKKPTSMRKTSRKFLFCFCVLCLLLTGCFETKGISIFNESIGIRYLRSNDEKTVELDAFKFSKEIIKNEIWEETFYINKNDILPFENISLGKYNIATSKNIFTIYDDNGHRPIGFTGPPSNRYFGILIPDIDFIDDTKETIDIIFPNEIVLNLHFEDEIFNSITFYKGSVDLHFVISDSSVRHLCYNYPNNDWGYYSIPSLNHFRSTTKMNLRFKIWLPETYDYLNNNALYEEDWDGDHYDLNISAHLETYYLDPPEDE